MPPTVQAAPVPFIPRPALVHLVTCVVSALPAQLARHNRQGPAPPVVPEGAIGKVGAFAQCGQQRPAAQEERVAGADVRQHGH